MRYASDLLQGGAQDISIPLPEESPCPDRVSRHQQGTHSTSLRQHGTQTSHLQILLLVRHLHRVQVPSEDGGVLSFSCYAVHIDTISFWRRLRQGFDSSAIFSTFWYRAQSILPRLRKSLHGVSCSFHRCERMVYSGRSAFAKSRNSRTHLLSRRIFDRRAINMTTQYP